MGGGHTSARDPAPEEAGVGGTRLGGGFVPEAGDGLRQAALPVPRPRWEFGDFGVRPALAVPGDQVVLGGAASQTRVLFRFSLWGQGINSAVPGVRLKSLIGPREPGLTRPKGAACASPGPGGILLPWRPLGGRVPSPQPGFACTQCLREGTPLALAYLRVVDAPPPPFQEGVAAGVGDSALLFLLEDSPLPVSLQLHNHCWGVHLCPPTQSGPAQSPPPLSLVPCKPGPGPVGASCAFLSTSRRTLDAKACPPPPAPALGPLAGVRGNPGRSRGPRVRVSCGRCGPPDLTQGVACRSA